MTQEAVVVLTHTTNPAIEPLVRGFDWSLKHGTNLDDLAEISSTHEVVAVLVDPSSLNLTWKQALLSVHSAAPRALFILCQRFSEATDWAEASAAGAFHVLRLPFDLSELRQSLGFMWAEKNKRFQVIPLTTNERSRLRDSAKPVKQSSSAVA